MWKSLFLKRRAIPFFVFVFLLGFFVVPFFPYFSIFVFLLVFLPYLFSDWKGFFTVCFFAVGGAKLTMTLVIFYVVID